MNSESTSLTPRLRWDYGTAYDFFQSLVVLHQPARFGVRGAWTAGMRARLSQNARKTLERGQMMIRTPVHWIYTLPPPKDVETVLWSLGQIAPERRLEILALRYDEPPEPVVEVLKRTARRGDWSGEELNVLRVYMRNRYRRHKRTFSEETLTEILSTWAAADAFGEEYLAALRNYHEAFFAEEEERIKPALQAALSRAQALAQDLPLPDLLEELSRGVRVDQPFLGTELVLVPSYWITPLMLLAPISPSQRICMFGARPPADSLIPGETVPDTLLRTLKALSDSTRLKILRYLAGAPMSPTELAHALRLRTPTVMHHLHVLRLAGLVQVTIAPSSEKERKRYALRPHATAEMSHMLSTYLEKGK